MKDDTKNIEERIRRLEERVSLVEEKYGSNQNQDITKGVQTKSLSLREFLLDRKPSNDVERTLAIGYFLEKYEGVASFNIEDILSAYVRAKEKKPININDKIGMNAKKGHIDEDRAKKDGKKSWYVTSSGERFVEAGFIQQ